MNGQEVHRLLEKIRNEAPLVHIIMNMVAAQNAANAVLQVGASPVMADASVEVEEIVEKADALVLNLGMLNPQKKSAMTAAGKLANQLGIPVILDPVGVAASTYRKETALFLLENIRIDMIRGNVAEIAWAAGFTHAMRGVDAVKAPVDVAELVLTCAQRWGFTAAVTGEMDAVSDGTDTWTIANGHPYMAKITGFGCMASAVTGAFAAVAGNALQAGTAALAAFGVAGELAGAKSFGPGSFLPAFLDCLYSLNEDQLDLIRIDRIPRRRQQDV